MKVSYIVVEKSKITNQSFRNAPYGISYNYFTGKLLKNLVFEHNLHDIYLTYDERSKESHPNQKYQQYIQTLMYGEALEKEVDIDMTITGANSSKVYGLMAVDIFCWSIYREITAGEDTFITVFRDQIVHKNELYK